MRKEIKKMTKGYGTVKFEGKEYNLTQDAWYDNGRYVAYATDAEGNTVRVYWDILPGHEDDEWEDEMCDWSKPADVNVVEICDMPIVRVQFMAGESRYGANGVNYMIGQIDDVELYAEIAVPDDADEDYGYDDLLADIKHKANAIGYDIIVD
jgi:hypothetical protein